MFYVNKLYCVKQYHGVYVGIEGVSKYDDESLHSVQLIVKDY